MADKISTIVMKVDLDCHRCYKKISKAICKLTERENIQTIAFDEKTNTVTISGRFDPKKLCKKLCCKAYNVIKDIQIKENKEKPKETKPAEPAEPKKDKPKETKPAEPAEPKKDKPKETKPDEPAEPKKDKPKETKPTDKPADKKDKPKDAKPAEPAKDKPKEAEPAEPKKDKPKEAEPAEPKKDKPAEAKSAEPAEPKKDKPKEAKPGEPAEPEKDKPKDTEPKKNQAAGIPAKAEQVWQPVWAGPGCACACRPGYEGYYGDYRGCWCGRGGYGGWMQEAPPLPVVYGAPVVYGGYNKSGTFFCEEDPQSSCAIM